MKLSRVSSLCLQLLERSAGLRQQHSPRNPRMVFFLCLLSDSTQVTHVAWRLNTLISLSAHSQLRQKVEIQKESPQLADLNLLLFSASPLWKATGAMHAVLRKAGDPKKDSHNLR